MTNDERPFDEAALRSAERELAVALASDDPTAWVDHYTEDAVFEAVGPFLLLEGFNVPSPNQLQLVIAFSILVLVLIFRPGDRITIQASLRTSDWQPIGKERVLAYLESEAGERREIDLADHGRCVSTPR